MKLDLDPRSEQLIDRQIRAGRYNSPEEVVASALEALPGSEGSREDQHSAVRDMLDFASQHQFTLGRDIRPADLVREGRKR